MKSAEIAGERVDVGGIFPAFTGHLPTKWWWGESPVVDGRTNVSEGFPPSQDAALESTLQLLRRARAGDRSALDSLCGRYLGPLRRWATGRLPRWARDLLDTDDLVQETLLRAIPRMNEFEPKVEGALQVYLRTALQNRIREEIRRIHRHPQVPATGASRPDSSPSPLEEAIGKEAVEAYERALETLDDEERQAIVARIELGFSYRRVAEALGKPTPDAARMTVSRALVRLAEGMGHER